MKFITRNINHCNRCLYKSNVCQRYSSKKATSADSADGSGDVEEGGWARRVLTGLQPTGSLHVGNYFAAVRRCVQLQERGDDLMVTIADLHSLTTSADGAALRRRTLETAATLLGAGVCPDRAVLWVQSAVPRHAELCWLLACLTTQARLHQLPQYKERSASGADTPVGVLLYPVLQAADVLLYRATHVPVGADQLQHLQLAALLARTARHRLGADLFPAPRPLLPEDGSDRIRSLRAPDKKMSKSEPDPKSRVLLTDCDDTIRRKVRKAVTDFNPQVTYEPDSRPGVSNLVRLHCLARGLLPEEAVAENEHLSTAMYKEVVAEALCEALAPVRERSAQLLARPDYLRDVLRHGAAVARARADVTWHDVAARAGLAPAAVLPDLVRRLTST